MPGINKVILVGYLGEDPDFKVLPDDTAVLSFPLATIETVNKNGAKVEQTEWHNIVMLRSLASAAAQVLKKGKLLYLEGKCRTRTFEDNERVKRYITEIFVESFKILGANNDLQEESLTNEQLHLLKK
ncbi:single-stranded DNA-binding protein [Mucilaginibacter sp. UR6-11]|uniref:single-stranded DNA-binding protein n=1 Tax=Mucilaginibacter sp. UR6-11 TaxID=1435644 RepID=UPI001E5C1FF5|nr:single-stranded DNA-binding protein [Mucilaginibacter sp. UR6-11]MCC8425903.1 single-stranded DNA-binding protein [Mucilaginibacter sp. UR6-11]